MPAYAKIPGPAERGDSERGDCAAVVLSVSRQLISVHRAKNALNIEGGLTMVALALIIYSEVCNFDMYLEKIPTFFFGRMTECFRIQF